MVQLCVPSQLPRINSQTNHSATPGAVSSGIFRVSPSPT